MLKSVRLVSNEPIKSLFLAIVSSLVNEGQDGVVDRQGLSSGEECERLEFGSRQFIPHEAPLLIVELRANNIMGTGFIRLTNNWVSKNLKVVFRSAVLLIM